MYLSKFPEAERKWLVSNGGGYRPFWRRDGRQLYYLNGKKLMVVDMSPPMIGKARVVFETDLAVADIALDGQRFVGMRSEKVPPATQLNVITGLFDNLKTRQRRPGAKWRGTALRGGCGHPPGSALIDELLPLRRLSK